VLNRLAVQRITPCGRCGSVQKVELQFHHGFEDHIGYQIGDLLEYDEGDTPDEEAEIWGYVEVCEQCGYTDGDDERAALYVIRVEHGRPVSVRRPTPDDFTRIGPY
jgi:hypothetical protein